MIFRDKFSTEINLLSFFASDFAILNSCEIISVYVEMNRVWNTYIFTFIAYSSSSDRKVGSESKHFLEILNTNYLNCNETRRSTLSQIILYILFFEKHSLTQQKNTMNKLRIDYYYG